MSVNNADLLSMGGSRAPPPPEKSQKYWVSLQYWSRSPERSQSYQVGIQCWAIIGTTAKRHLNNGPLIVVFGSSVPSSTKKMKKKKLSNLAHSDKTF